MSFILLYYIDSYMKDQRGSFSRRLHFVMFCETLLAKRFVSLIYSWFSQLVSLLC